MSRDMVTEFGEATASESTSTFIKKKCLTCNRQLSRRELFIGLCPYCLEERAESAIYHFRPLDPAKNQFPHCYECQKEIYLLGLMTWDTPGRSWKLLCSGCGEKQLAKDEQYRNTPFGYKNKLK